MELAHRTMTHRQSEPAIDRPGAPPKAPSHRTLVLILGAALAVVMLVASVRLTGVGADTGAVPKTPPIAYRDLHFADRPDGSIRISDAADGRIIDTVAPGTNGFLRGTMRSLARERRQGGIGEIQAFRVAAYAGGMLSLEDPATGRRIELGSFGPDNAAVFARLLTGAPSATPDTPLKPE